MRGDATQGVLRAEHAEGNSPRRVTTSAVLLPGVGILGRSANARFRVFGLSSLSGLKRNPPVHFYIFKLLI